MTTNITRSATSLEEAFYALALAKPKLDAAVLDEFARRYPDHAGALTDFAIELVLDALQDDEEEVLPPESAETSAAVSRAMSRFHNRLYVVKKTGERAPETKGGAEPANPFSSLDRAELRALGARIGANTVFVLKLRDRQIEPETIPEGFTRCLATEMQAPVGVVIAHFAGRPTIARIAHYKAERKPEAGKKQTFEEAVRASGLSDEQQRHLLSL